ncbi:beta-eliminating lyase-related protein [Streptomyces sp. TRM70308]
MAERRLAAWRAAGRKLSAGLVRPLAERLADVGAALETAGVGEGWTDLYGNGVVEAVEERVAGLLGKPAAVWFPTGTMAQQAVLRCWAGRTGSLAVGLHPLAHPVRHERDALSRLSGLHPVPVGGGERPVTAEDVRAVPEPFGTLALELPLRDAAFRLPTWEELTDTVAAARERDAVVHVDGARLWECATWFGRPLAEIAELADSVYVSFYKSLGGLSGAAVAGPEDVAAEARVWRHRYGGQLFQQWPAAVTALAGLERELPRLPAYVAQARRVAAALHTAFGAAGGPPWYAVLPEEPHTHQFQVWLPYPADVLDEASVRQAEESGTALFGRWRDRDGVPGAAMTECTVDAPGLAWTEADVHSAVTDFLTRL